MRTLIGIFILALMAQLDGLRTKGIASSFEARTQTPVNDQDRSGWRRTPSGRRRARSEDRKHMSRLLNDRYDAPCVSMQPDDERSRAFLGTLHLPRLC
jgi:hypothetical protein